MERDMSSNIEESIGFVKHIFQKVKQIDLQESASKVVNALVSEFGEEVVFSKNPISITENLLDRIFQVLNQYLFDQKLDQIPIQYLPYKVIAEKLDESNEYREPRYSITLKNNFSGVYIVRMDEVFDENNSLVDLLPIANTDVIYINSSYMEKSIFAFVVSSLCHEMIHYYDKLFGQLKDCRLKSMQIDKHIDSHTTPTFRKFMKTANENNIRVIASLSGYSYEQLMDDAFVALSEEDKLAEEDVFTNVSGKCIAVVSGHTVQFAEFD